MMENQVLQNSIVHLLLKDPGNRLPNGNYIFEQPLLGFASATDPIFKKFCQEDIIGSFYRQPKTWLPTAATVISYFLPFSEFIRRKHSRRTTPSVEWLHGRFLGESFNDKLRKFIETELRELGGESLAPAMHHDFQANYSIYSSNWSERHVAYAAGLGSFGLNRSLITAKGVAGRFGSVITDLKFLVTPRLASNPFENCPFLADQSCGVCIKRCPTGAITAQGKNKSTCYYYMFIEDHIKKLRDKYAYKHSICGKCQVNVPCEESIP